MSTLAAKRMMDWSDTAYFAEWLAFRGYEWTAWEQAGRADRLLEDVALLTLMWLLEE